MTSRTSLIISGSSALVGSSKSMTFGSIASARAIATRCCWPPESCAGSFVAWLRDADAVEQRHRLLVGVRLLQPAHLDRAERDVLEDRHVREEVEGLEDHADVGAQLREALALFGQRLAVDRDLAASRSSPAG